MIQTTHQRASLMAVLGLVLVIAGCNKFLEAQSGSKSMDRAGKNPVNNLSAAPALSVPPGQEHAAPGEMVIARAETAPGSTQRLEEIRQEQIATAAAGLQDVFFEFDRWTITDQGRQALQTNAEWLRSNPNKKLMIQGHCDERGTAAYNLLLGEKRARSIRQYLMDLGVKADRLGSVSYGKERPFCREQSEECYQQNRRGHLSVQVR